MADAEYVSFDASDKGHGMGMMKSEDWLTMCRI